MAFRFWRRVRIAPGVTLNISKSGASLSFGPRGAKFTIGPRGRRTSIGVPGTGMFYTLTDPAGRARRGGRSAPPAAPTPRPEDRLTLGFFKRLVTPRDEQAFVDACRELVAGNESEALRHARDAVHLADGAYLAGFLSVNKDLLDDAGRYLTAAAGMCRSLGRYFRKYGVAATLSLTITDEVSAHVGPTLRGVLLGLVEVYQRRKDWRQAVECLKRLERIAPDDVVVKLSLAEMLLDVDASNRRFCKRVVRLTEGIGNDTPIHTALLLYKARALRALGLLTAARETLTCALRRRKGRDDELLRALRYERALVYEESGQRKRARNEFEKIYAEDPEYEDVARRIGVG